VPGEGTSEASACPTAVHAPAAATYLLVFQECLQSTQIPLPQFAIALCLPAAPLPLPAGAANRAVAVFACFARGGWAGIAHSHKSRGGVGWEVDQPRHEPAFNQVGCGSEGARLRHGRVLWHHMAASTRSMSCSALGMPFPSCWHKQAAHSRGTLQLRPSRTRVVTSRAIPSCPLPAAHSRHALAWSRWGGSMPSSGHSGTRAGSQPFLGWLRMSSTRWWQAALECTPQVPQQPC
jgi:hypothetical protein